MQFFQAFVNRPIMATAVNLIVLIMGVVAFDRLELRHTPSSTHQECTVTTDYPGADSLTVEQRVTKPLEDTLSGLDGILKLSSESSDGASVIHIKFKSTVDSTKAMSEVRDRMLGAMNGLPEGAKRPEIQESSGTSYPILYLVFEDKHRTVAALSDYIRRTIEDRLRLIEGIAAIDRWGDQLYQIVIQLDPARLMEHQVAVTDVVNALRREKAFASAGEIEQSTEKKSVVLTAALQAPTGYSQVIVKTTPEGHIRVGHLATVSVIEKSTDLRIRVEGEYKVGLQVTAKPQANPLRVAERVRAFVKDLKQTLPPNMKVSILYDATRPFNASILSLRHTMWEAIVLVGVIVTLSLASIRAALLPMLTVPLCLIGTFMLMWILGFSINPITLLALVLAVGLVVDDAIVVVENIHHYLETGLTPAQAARRGMKEITFAVIVMTITLASVYLPIAFQTDSSAVMFREFAWTLAGSVLISGFVALTLTPALCGKFLKQSKSVHKSGKFIGFYQKSLHWALQQSRCVGAIAILFALLGVWGFVRLPSELMPKEDIDYIQGYIDVANTVPEAVRVAWLKQIEQILADIPERENFSTNEWQHRWLSWMMVLKPRVERSRSTETIIQALTPKLKAIVGPRVGVIMENGGLDAEEALKIVVQYSSDYKRIVNIVKAIIHEAKQHPAFERFKSDEISDIRRVQVEVDRAFAEELGINIDAIEDTLYTFLSGRKTTRFNFKGFEYDVQVQAATPFRKELNSMNQFFVASNDGQWVPLGSLVKIKEVNEPHKIKHTERIRSAEIAVTLKPKTTLTEAMAILTPIIKKHLPAEARYRFEGKAEKYQEAERTLWLTYGLALVFIYLVLAALFESFMHPWVVLLTVPLSMTGAVWAVNGYGGTHNIYTSIGLVTLVGLITKHGILIVDFSNRLRNTGLSLLEAVQTAAERRLRPVLMTTLAMIFGAVPLLFSLGSGANARVHIGLVIIGGMISGTLFSLYVVPVVYLQMTRGRV